MLLRRLIILALLLGALALPTFGEDAPSETPANSLHASPTPPGPPTRPTAVPNSQHRPGVPALSPENGSVMGLGIQIPFGSTHHRKKPEPKDSEQTFERPAGNSQERQ